ncbi:MAG: TetR/AcrR family transcriptional regulator [Ruminococcaceae bacterium]|nr:TetR/AcrR family transcriptional regulator [Oscillospiraceae bacterium]
MQEDNALARTKQPSLLRAKIVKSASELFFEKGFSKATSSELCSKVGMGTGNLTFYFPTKEHILAVLVQMMIDYQWKEMESAADEGKSSLLAYCLELSTLVAIADEFPEMNDFFAAAYSHPMTLDLIRANDVEKVKQVFSEYTQGWDNEKYTENEAITSGIEYATIMKTDHSASVEHRIEGALNAIMLLFGVPEETRKIKVAKVLAMDYRAIGRKVYENFKRYVTETNEHNLEKMQNAKYKMQNGRGENGKRN